jgi:hypothetical protein
MQITTVLEPGTTIPIANGTEGVLSIAWPNAPQHLGLQAEEEVLVTFSGKVADRHPPTAANPGDHAAAKPTEGVRLVGRSTAGSVATVDPRHSFDRCRLQS